MKAPIAARVGYIGNNVIDRASSRLRHARPTARRTKSPSFAGKGNQLFMGAVDTTQAHRTMRQNATFKKHIKLVFDKIGQARFQFQPQLAQRRSPHALIPTGTG